jgi:hypothetical protein
VRHGLQRTQPAARANGNHVFMTRFQNGSTLLTSVSTAHRHRALIQPPAAREVYRRLRPSHDAEKTFRSDVQRTGLPEIIQVDNGAPFASMGPGGLSKLSVWWIGLGIAVSSRARGCPQDRSLERMHPHDEGGCCTPPSANAAASTHGRVAQGSSAVDAP